MSTSAPPASGRPPILRALGYLRRYRLEALGALLSLLLVSVANLGAPQMIRIAIDHGLARGEIRPVWLAVGGLVAIALGRGLFNFLQGYLAERASQGVAFDLRDALFARIQRLSFSYYDQAQTGQLLTRLTSDVEAVRTFVGSGVVQFAAAAAMLVGCAGLLLYLDPVLALAALSTVPPILWVLRRFMQRMRPLFGQLQALLGSLNTTLQEDLRGLRVVRAFSGEARELERYGKTNAELKEKNLRVVDALAGNFPLVTFIASMGTLMVVGVGGWRILHQKLTLGELVAFISYLTFLLMPLMTLGFFAASMSRASASAQRLFELLDTAVEVADRPGAVPLPPLQGRIELRDVRFRYAGSDREILRGVSVTLEPGQLVAVLGTTGSGKSTLINLLPRFYDVTGGAVLLDGHDVRDVTLASLRSQMGVVLQDALLFSGTVRENIAYGRPEATQAQVEAAAEAAQAAEFIRELPQGYDTLVGERGVGLSGGQRQRLAIARALLTDPRLLILDDSTSAVDARTETAIQGALDALMRDKRRTAIVIAQRISTVRDADLILVLDEGRIAAKGRHEELKASSELYNDILGSQLQPPRQEEVA
ncbi:ABC transporter ATP-binding protein [Corallococcus exiguus]|uniref:ABC transporter ATP-binding protein n=1 Tax=Corallococcus TaxID=83461 RepID=UPI000ECC1580|nr:MULTISPECIES: ABC transporter ATP-binding protein [unclassified Corallococcus]NNC15876.1 ABC transporter ATP-binding protein [Corallococcus exiguus]NRD53727.1 ABC transporter ATP-binding protein [Corallococcus exiguus]NRD61425.1 ABC transporter ATP-binding protein [Corallococcus exiguus]RKI09369.1 ABC transporter ATP-binding protein [Corallococcus sp. AB030]RUO95067.1 ABC transporter ATP-binding protein [Corallococcus sp. AB018]